MKGEKMNKFVKAMLVAAMLALFTVSAGGCESWKKDSSTSTQQEKTCKCKKCAKKCDKNKDGTCSEKQSETKP
jgi:hypothetical protein